MKLIDKSEGRKCWEEFKKRIIDEIHDINFNTEWSETEPDWWLEMMKVYRIVKKISNED